MITRWMMKIVMPWMTQTDWLKQEFRCFRSRRIICWPSWRESRQKNRCLRSIWTREGDTGCFVDESVDQDYEWYVGCYGFGRSSLVYKMKSLTLWQAIWEKSYTRAISMIIICYSDLSTLLCLWWCFCTTSILKPKVRTLMLILQFLRILLAILELRREALDLFLVMIIT